MDETLAKRLNALSFHAFKVELTLLFECLNSLSQLFVVMEIFVIVFGSIDAMHGTIMSLCELLQPFLREKIRDGFHYYSAVRR